MSPEDAAAIERLYRKHVGSGPIDLQRLRDCVRRECLAAERGQIFRTPGAIRELRADRASIGRVFNRSAR